MTVESVEAGVIRLGNGVTTAFPFSFNARNVDEVKVSLLEGFLETPVDPGEYSVGLASVGGTVTFTVAPADGATLFIYRDTPRTQLVSVAGQQRYDPEVVEGVWDKLTYQTQELGDQLARAVKTVPGEDPADLLSAISTAAITATAAAATATVASEAAAESAAEALAKENSMLAWAGAWLTATAYTPSQIVYYQGSSYVCVVGHTSGVFATDLSANKWAIFVAQGASGVGSGDMLNSQNLSGLTDKPLALATIGGQAAAATLTSLAGLSLAAGDLLYATGADTLVRLPKGTAGQALVMNPGATAPEWSTSGGITDAFHGGAASVAAGVTLRIGALQRLSPGGSVRSRRDSVASSAASSTFLKAYSFSFIQVGTIRLYYEHRVTSGFGGLVEVRRTRNYVTTVLSSIMNSGWAGRTIDISVLPGDTVDLWVSGYAGGAGQTQNVRLQTNGEDLWPGVDVPLEGNTYA